MGNYRKIMERVLQGRSYNEIVEAEATALIGADPFERSEDRITPCNGTRARVRTTTAG